MQSAICQSILIMGSKRQEIFETLASKSRIKQEVYSASQGEFKQLKGVLQRIENDYSEYIKNHDERVIIKYADTGDFSALLNFGGDVLLFYLHSNVFAFEKDHFIHEMSYVRKNRGAEYCGIVHIYNFLADSFKYNRLNDIGFLIARIFINADRHFFTEGKGVFNHQYFNFGEQQLSQEYWLELVESAINYSLRFDLHVPQYEKVQLVTLNQVKQLATNIKLPTSKRMGFKMSSRERK